MTSIQLIPSILLKVKSGSGEMAWCLRLPVVNPSAIFSCSSGGLCALSGLHWHSTHVQTNICTGKQLCSENKSKSILKSQFYLLQQNSQSLNFTLKISHINVQMLVPFGLTFLLHRKTIFTFLISKLSVKKTYCRKSICICVTFNK